MDDFMKLFYWRKKNIMVSDYVKVVDIFEKKIIRFIFKNFKMMKSNIKLSFKLST